jgi:hypothetical protein
MGISTRQRRQPRDGRAQHPLPQQHRLVAQRDDEVADLRFLEIGGIALRQLQDQILGACDDRGKLLHQVGDLGDQQRQQHEEDAQQHRQEQQEHQPHRQIARHPQADQEADGAFQQVGDDQAGDHRGQHVAGQRQDAKPDDQQHGQDHHLRVREVPAEPGGDNVHSSGITNGCEQTRSGQISS